MSKGLERLNNMNLPCSNCKELKALEIIKDKEVQVAIFKICNSCEGYNLTKGLFGKFLTQEEYNLLKDVLL